MTDQEFSLTPEIAVAVCKVMSQVRTLGRDDKNKYDSYDFASIDNFLAFVNPLCAEAGLFILHDEAEYDYYENKKQSLWMRVHYKLYLCHVSGAICGPFRRCVAVPMNGAQSYGSAQSYVMKQFFRGLFMIPTGDKDDADLNAKDEDQTKPRLGNKSRVIDNTPPEDSGGDKVEDTTPFNDDSPEAADINAAREIAKIQTITDIDELIGYWQVLQGVQKHIARRPDVIAAKDDRKHVISGGKEKS